MEKIYKKVILALMVTSFILGSASINQSVSAISTRESYTAERAFTFDSTTKTITGYDKSYGLDVNIPSTINGVAVENIGENAFNGKTLTGVTIPDSVKVIGNAAFNYNPKITKIVLGNSVESIGESAFWNSQATELILPETLVEIGNNAFANVTITNLVIPDSVETIGDGSFGRGTILNLTLGNSVKYIGSNAFRCPITQLDLPDSVETIGASAFTKHQLTSLKLPANLTTLGDKAFESNSINVNKIQTLEINDKLKSIGEYCFQYNDIKEVILPEGFETLSRFAFYKNKISKVSLPSSLSQLGQGCFQSNEIDSITIPEKVTNIESSALFGNKLTDLIIPSTVKEIGVNAFGQNSLTKVEIPSTVETIWDSAFSANKITKVKLNEGLKFLSDGAFKNNNLTNLEIPNSVTTLGKSVMNTQTAEGQYYKDGSTWKLDFSTLSDDITVDNVDEVKLDGAAVDYSYLTNVATFYDDPAGKTLTYKYFVSNDTETDLENTVSLTLSLVTVADYTVTFDAQGGTVTPTSKIVQSTGTYGELPTPTKTGYDFQGWYTSADNTATLVEASTNVSATSDHTLYAKWAATSYSITYHDLDGTTHSNPTTYTIETPTITLTSPTQKAGYTFSGWYDQADGQGTKVLTIDVGSSGNKNLYAFWQVKPTVSIAEDKIHISRVFKEGVNTIGDKNSKALTISMQMNGVDIATDYDKLEWEVENIAGFEGKAAVAKVDQLTGKVIGLKSGVAKITVKLKDNYDPTKPETFDTVIVVVPGDVNKNGTLEMSDFTVIMRSITYFTALEDQVLCNDKTYLSELADMDGNGFLTTADATYISRMVSMIDIPSN